MTPHYQKFYKSIPILLVLALTILLGTRYLVQSHAATVMPVASIGAMALNTGQENYLGDTSRDKYVILQDAMYGKVAAIKAANPNTKVLVYKNVAGTNTACQYDSHRSSGVSYCYAKANHPEWFIKDNTGNPFAFCDFSYLYWMDINNPAYQQQWLSDVTSNAKADGFDGVFMDDTNTHPGHCKDNGGLTTGTPSYTDVAYGNAMNSFIAAVGPGLKVNGLLAVPNIAADPWNSSQESIALSMVPNISVFFREFFMHWGTNLTTRFQDNAWLDVMKQMEAVSATSDYYANTYSNGSTPNVTDMVYGRASFLLAWNGSSNSAFMYHTDCQCDSFNSAWARDIGTPLAPRYQVGTAWRRDFSAGTAVVNPSSTVSATVSLGGTFINESGAQVTSITLAPGTAEILSRASSPDTMPPVSSITSPIAGATVSGIAAVTATAADTVGVTRVDFYVNYNVVQSGTSKSYSWNTTAMNDASYSLQVKAYDAAGNVGSSPVVQVITKNSIASTAVPTAPIVTIASPSNNSYVNGTVTITASADVPSEANSIEIDIDGQLFSYAQSSSISTTWNTRRKQVASGTHVITVIAKNSYGLTGKSSITVTK